MSTFKKGDTVRITGNGFAGGFDGVPASHSFNLGDEGTVTALPGEDPDTKWAIGHYSVEVDGVIQAVHPDHLALVATPAPLDPRLVKAGDTVTLVRGEPHPAKIEGVVQEVKEYPTFNPFPLRFFIGGYLVSPYDYTLADHQPAPEPELEWKPGTVADITVGEGTVRAIRSFPGTWRSLGNQSFGDDRVTDVHTLVVIDPAEVDVEALMVAANQGFGGVARVNDSTANNIVRNILAELGIEASS